jgi:hypothetical protein
VGMNRCPARGEVAGAPVRCSLLDDGHATHEVVLTWTDPDPVHDATHSVDVPVPDRYDDFCPTCDAPNPTHTETCAASPDYPGVDAVDAMLTTPERVVCGAVAPVYESITCTRRAGHEASSFHHGQDAIGVRHTWR